MTDEKERCTVRPVDLLSTDVSLHLEHNLELTHIFSRSSVPEHRNEPVMFDTRSKPSSGKERFERFFILQ